MAMGSEGVQTLRVNFLILEYSCCNRGQRMWKALAALITPLLLSACWTGPDFYDGAQNVQPIPAGKYKPVRVYAMFPDDEARLANEPIGSRIEIAYDDRGNVLIKGNDDIDAMSNVRLVTLDANRGLYIVQGRPGSAAPSLDISIYGLIALTPNGYRLSVPPCNGARRLTPGSPVVVKGLLVKKRCSFSDRASFEHAMLDFANDPTSWTEYRRVKDRRVTNPHHPSTG
jgi:hypothetical protein